MPVRIMPQKVLAAGTLT
jgi:hypothetical protein